MTTGNKASTKASIATGKNTPVPDEDEDEAKDAAQATGKAAHDDAQEDDDDFVSPIKLQKHGKLEYLQKDSKKIKVKLATTLQYLQKDKPLVKPKQVKKLDQQRSQSEE